MVRSKFSIFATAWLLAAIQAEGGPIASAAENEGTSAELASLGGLLQALGAGVVGNGALLYPTAASSHQRAEEEIMASDTATRVLKKVHSVLKDGGMNDDENGGDDESKSVTYLAKPALIFHKEEVPPPNPLAGNVLPLPGGALMYTPSPTAAAAGEPTSGPLASVKAAYGNLFAASPYQPSYTLNKPHAAVIIEEVTDMISLKSAQQRMEDNGEDANDSDSDDEDEYGRKRKGKKSVRIVSLETIDSTSTFINPFTRGDFPFGLMTPTLKKDEAEDTSSSKKVVRKTIRRVVGSQSATGVSASLGKDGAITVVNNGPAPSPSTTTSADSKGTTIVIPAASLQTTSAASSSATASAQSSSESPATSSSAAHEESSSSAAKNEDTHANEVTRVAHGHHDHSSEDNNSHAQGHRRDASMYDPIDDATPPDITQLAKETSLVSNESLASPSVTIGSQQPTTSPKHRKMHVVRVLEVKKSKHLDKRGMEDIISPVTKLPYYDGYFNPSVEAIGSLANNLERVFEENERESEDEEEGVRMEGSDVVSEEATVLETDVSEMESETDVVRDIGQSSTSAEVAKTASSSSSSSSSSAKPSSSTSVVASKSLPIESIKSDEDEPESTTLDKEEDLESGFTDLATGGPNSDGFDSDSDTTDTDETDSDSGSDDESDSPTKPALQKRCHKDVTLTMSKEQTTQVPQDYAAEAIQRMAAIGLREAENALLEFEHNSDEASEVLMSDTPMLRGVQRMEAPKEKDSDDEDGSDDDSESESDEDERETSTRAGKEADEEDDDESESESDTDNDSDSTSGDPLKSMPRATPTNGKQEDDELSKALSEALAESASQATDLSITKVETMDGGATFSGDMSSGWVGRDFASDHLSEFARDFASDHVSDFATDEIQEEEEEDIELVTGGISTNSDGDEIEFVTQLVADKDQEDEDKKKAVEREMVNESPSIVVMASIDEEYEEDDLSSDMGTGDPVRRVAAKVDVLGADNDEEPETSSVPHKDSLEATADIGVIKDSQNRALNIGMGNLRRHI